MSVQNTRNPRAAKIKFIMREDFASCPSIECLTLTLVTNGKATIKVNGNTAALSAPCIFLSSWHDKIVLTESRQLAAKSISFHPTLINKSLTFENLGSNDFDEIADGHDHELLSPFLTRKESFFGIIEPSPQVYSRISEWFDLAAKENSIVNDRNRLHRIRSYLLQILFALEDTIFNDSYRQSDESMIETVLDYLHANFSKEISLDSLCKLVYVNRTSLNRKFKAHTRRTPIDYLLHHRLSIACELLTHSSLSIGKIAETTGFKYETYFTRQFTAKIGVTPTQYRQNDGYETLNTKESRIVEEF